jgi:CRISPR-associated endonuclease/helicase Cas3
MDKDTLYAHTPPPGGTDWHLLIDHLMAVAALARGFAEPFGAGDLAYQLGLWHDIGKSNPAFQAYLQMCHANPDHKGRGPDHKAAGTAMALQYAQPLALLVQGHHGGLKNQNDLKTWFAERQQDRSADGTTSAIDAARSTMHALLPAMHPSTPLTVPSYVQTKEAAEFFLRMLFSTLVDADFLDTEHHRNRFQAARRGMALSLEVLWQRFVADQQQYTGHTDTPVNQARQTLYAACLAAAEQPPGLFRLAIPTGGGKTRSGIAFALRHALRHAMERVIVAVPYISITEQTANVYRSIFEQATDDTPIVLEHHSGAAARRSETSDYHPGAVWARLAAENWDAPLIVTTTVQLFESLFASQTSRCRKLHRLARSVIILDEVQALPLHLLTPILDGIRQLCTNYGATVVLSTATQPAFDSVRSIADLPAHDIVPDAAHWFTALKRVEYTWQVEQSLTWQEVAETMRTAPQVLAVVNTKQDALDLLDALDDPEALHLSTLLCGAHRRAVIDKVKARLHAQQPCRLVSTQVIEAGVDLDFPLVLRALGPLDRIIQAAGRCNREGRLERGQVIVFMPATNHLPPGSYRAATDVTRTLIGKGAFDPDDPESVRGYFRQVFTTVSLDREQIQKCRAALDYPEVAQRFRMIDEDTEDVIVAYGDDDHARQQVHDLIAALQRKPPHARMLLRRLQPYLVSIRASTAQKYRSQGLIAPLEDFTGLGIWQGRYDLVRGLVPDDDRELLVF